MRIALRLGYLGGRYHGFQRQPGLSTVEATVREALESLGLIKEEFCYAGRTDRGVNALGQVISFPVDPVKKKLAVPRVINSRLPRDVWTWAWAPVPESFSSRHGALWREYRYVLYGRGLDPDRMRAAARKLVGLHDFQNFSAEKKRDTVRNLMGLEIKTRGDIVVFDLRAEAFLWNMARRVVSALETIGSGERDVEWIEDLLDPQLNRGVTAAPPEGLILMDVKYPGVRWIEDTYSRKMASERLSKEMKRRTALAEAVGEIKQAML